VQRTGFEPSPPLAPLNAYSKRRNNSVLWPSKYRAPENIGLRRTKMANYPRRHYGPSLRKDCNNSPPFGARQIAWRTGSRIRLAEGEEPKSNILRFCAEIQSRPASVLGQLAYLGVPLTQPRVQWVRQLSGAARTPCSGITNGPRERSQLSLRCAHPRARERCTKTRPRMRGKPARASRCLAHPGNFLPEFGCPYR